MASKLSLYNAALTEIGEAKLASLTVNETARHVLDTVYDDVLADCLEAGDWNFAIRTVKLDADTGIAPNFGHTEIFAKPTDWVRTVALCTDEYLTTALSDASYKDEGATFVIDTTPVYLAYVSDDASYGLDLTAWPRSFTRYVEIALADRIVLRLTQGQGDKERLTRDMMRACRVALARDSRNEGLKFHRRSSWNDARRTGNTRDRGSRSNLTG